MSKQKSDDPIAASIVPEDAKPRAHSHALVPRSWLLLITALGIAPWLVLGALRYWPFATSAAPPAAPTASGASGPWGRLTVRPITISPPLEFVSRNWGELGPSAWMFPNMGVDQAAAFLLESGMSQEDVTAARATVRPSREINGVALLPADDVVRRLSPAGRAKIYKWLGQASTRVDLGRTPINFDQLSAYRFNGARLVDWLGTELAPETVALVEPYIYSEAGFLYFADIERVRGAIADPEELQRLAKRLLRQRTAIVSLQPNAPSEIDTLTEYWGRGGRRTDIRPLLESIQQFAQASHDASAAVDISHLLPTLARQHLYRYPRVTVEDMQRPLLANCLWTALNFFSAEPDARFLDVTTAITHLKTDYYLVQDRMQLGDVVVFADTSGNLVHVAVYLADGLLFGKNGTTALAPWSILTLDQLKGHYIEYSDTWQISYHRRKDL